MYNVTLRGGITSGTFRDRGELPNVQECLRICCIAKSCDLAFMLSKHCFSVTCKNQSLCEVVTARTSGLKPQIAYIYARSNIINHQFNQLNANSQSEASNETTHSHRKDGKNKHRKAKKESLNQVKPSMPKKKPYKRKKVRGKKKHRQKYGKSNRAKLERMYAEERVLLRKLALLKLRMEMLKKKNLGKDKNINDNVLLEAFEDKPKIAKKSWYKAKTSSPRVKNKIQKIGKSSAVKLKRLKMKPRPNTSREAGDENKELSNVGKLFIRNMTTSRNTSAETSLMISLKINTQINRILTERNQSVPNRNGYTAIFLPPFKINRTDSNSSHSVQILVNNNRNIKTSSNLTDSKDVVNETQDHFKYSMGHQNYHENTKQNKIGVASLQESKKHRKVNETYKHDINKNVSLEEMISQTTEMKDSKWRQTVHNEVEHEKKTFLKDRYRNLNLYKGAAKDFLNIVGNISSPSPQSDENPIETRTLPMEDFSSSKETIKKSRRLYPDEAKKDLMVLNKLQTFSTEKRFTLQRNRSQHSSSHRKGDNS